MTDVQKYAEVLKELGQLIADRNLTIQCNEYIISDLRRKLAAAEEQRDAAEKKLARYEAREGGAA